MNIASFSTYARFEGHSIQAKLQAPQADVVSFVYALPERKLMSQIAEEVLQQYPLVFMAHIMGDSRERNVCMARQHIWWQIVNERPDLSMAAIARKFDRDRQSVGNGIRRHAARIERQRRGLT